MNTQFHTPSFGDEVFEVGNIGGATSSSTPNSSLVTGNIITNNKTYMYQQQTPQSVPQTKRMISLHNTSDEYHTANEESFTTANTNLINTTNNGQHQQQPAGVNSIMTTPTTTMAARKQMLPLGQNEPAKPLSAYALFFRDTVSAIKQQNPSCTFQELSKIVASMWDALDPLHKTVYNKKNELARNEYLNQMRVYRQQLEQQQQQAQAQEQTHEQNSINTDTNTPITSTPQQQQQQQLTAQQVATNNSQLQQTPQSSTNSNSAVSSTNSTSSTAPPADEQIRLLTEAGSVQKCTRESCTKRAIINPDWEDEYCSNECVVIHCRNVFNEWVQSNLESKQQQQQQSLQQQTTAT